MTYAVEKVKAGRRPFSIVELDLDACSLTYGIAPCTASLTAVSTLNIVYNSGRDFGISEDTLPTGIAISSDGTRLLVTGRSNDKIYSYTLISPFDLGSAVYDGSGFDLDVSGEDLDPEGIFLTADGLTLFMVGNENNRVYSYTLSSANDLSSATYDGIGVSLDISTEDSTPRGLTVSSDGLHLYMAGEANVKVYAYTMSGANDLSTATYDGAPDDLDVSGQDATPQGLAMTADGTKLFVVGKTNDSIYSYTLGTPFDLGTASYISGEDLDVSGQDTGPHALALSFDNRFLYLLGNANDKAFQYTFAVGKCFNTFATCQDTANFDLETKTYSFCSPEIGKSRAYDAIPSVRKIDVTPMKLDPGLSLGKRGAAKITFQDHPHHDRGVDKYALEREDGTAGVPAYTPHDQGSFWGKLTARNPHHVGRIMRLKTGFIPWDQDLDPSNQASVSAAAAIADVLTRTYAIEQIDGPDASGKVTVTGKDLLKLADDARAECPARNSGRLSADLDSSITAPVISSSDGAAADIQPVSTRVSFITMKVELSGKYLFTIDAGGGTAFLERWTMSTLNDLTTASKDGGQSIDLVAINGGFTPQDQWFSKDGLKYYHSKSGGGTLVLAFTMTTAWDLTTLTYDGDTFAPPAGVRAGEINDDGSVMFLMDEANDILQMYDMSTPFDITTAVVRSDHWSIDTSGLGTNANVFSFNAKGDILGILEFTTKDAISWYFLPRPFDLSVAVYKGAASDTDTSGEHTQPAMLSINEEKAFVGETLGDQISSYPYSIGLTGTLTPTGIGNAEYSASGTIRIGDELIEYTRSGDVLTPTLRGAINTENADHNSNDIVQECFKFDAQQIDLIIGTLLKDFANIDTAFIDEATWATEASTFLSTFVYTALITEPTGVRKLINELCLQSNCLLYWHETDAEFKFLALRQPSTELTVTEQNMIAGSFKQVDLPKLRLTRVTIRFNRATGTARLDTPTSFLQTYQSVDADAETVNEFGDVRHMTVNSRWMGADDLAIATEAADAILARYVDTPQQFIFALDVKDADIWTGSIISIQSRYEQDIFGADGSVVAQVIEVRETPNGGFIYKAISI